MSAVGLEGIDHAVQQAHIWINELEDRLGWQSKARAYRPSEPLAGPVPRSETSWRRFSTRWLSRT
jgi:hypothetical protein